MSTIFIHLSSPSHSSLSAARYCTWQGSVAYLSYVRSEEGFDLQKVYDSFSRTWEYKSVSNKIRFAKISDGEVLRMHNPSFNISFEILLRQPHVTKHVRIFILSILSLVSRKQIRSATRTNISHDWTALSINVTVNIAC